MWKYFDNIIPGGDFPELYTHGIVSSVLGIIVHGIRMYREKNPILKCQPLLSFLRSSDLFLNLNFFLHTIFVFLGKKTARYHRLLWKHFDDTIPGGDFLELDTHCTVSSVLGIIMRGIRMYREKNPILKLQPLLSFLRSSLISF